jgi:hypothetical protein
MGASTSRNPKGLHGLYRDNFILFHRIQPALGPTKPHIETIVGDFSQEIKRKGREADHSLSSAEVKNEGGMPPLSLMFSWHVA